MASNFGTVHITYDDMVMTMKNFIPQVWIDAMVARALEALQARGYSLPAADDTFYEEMDVIAEKIIRAYGVPAAMLGLPEQKGNVMLGYPAYSPAVLPNMPPVTNPMLTPPKGPKGEPRVGLVVVGEVGEQFVFTLKHSANAVVFHEGDNLDIGLHEYIVVHQDNDYHRQQAEDVRNQLKQLSARISVVIVPVGD